MALEKINKNAQGVPDGTYTLVSGGTLYGSMPLASLVFFSGDTDKIPTGFCIADGRALSRTTYASLFAILGTTWGSGDGSTTFNIPDLSGKTAMGVETGHDLGASEDGALPNITGNIEIGGKTGTTYGILINNGHGALKSSNSSTTSLPTTNTTTGNSKIEVDASLSNSIYTDGQTKVDPANVRAYWIIKISEVALPADFLAKVDEAVEDALVPIIGTATPTEQLVSGDIRYVKSGNVCTCYFNGIEVNTSEGVDSRILCSGLPHLASNAGVFFVAWANGNSCVMDIEIDGRLRDAGDTVLGNKNNIYGSFTYACK